jgi:hypothetical protein
MKSVSAIPTCDHPSYTKPDHANPTRHLMLTRLNGDDVPEVEAALLPFGRCTPITLGRASNGFVSFNDVQGAVAAMDALHHGTLPHLSCGSTIKATFSDVRVPKTGPSMSRPLPAVTTAQDCPVPGLALYPQFVSPQEEQELLQLLDQQPWEELAKRRVQHYGYTFSYLVSRLG